MVDDERPRGPDHFISDGPILRKHEDRLGRVTFASQLAKALRGWRGDGSLVVALYGGWGTGKSSVKNLVIEELDETAHDHIEIVELNVWEFANRDRIISTFLDQLGLVLGKGAVETTQPSAQLAKQLKKYATYLASARDLTEVVQGNGAAIAGAVSALLIAVGFSGISPTVLTTLGVLGAAASFAMRKSATVAASIANAVSARGDQVKTLGEAKQAVQLAITKLAKPLLVVLDDLDRLTPSETLEVLQLLKANLDFKGVLFFVLCDRAITEAHISKALGVAGREYLEKIVQVGFTMPEMNQPQVDAVLFERLDVAIKQFGLEARFDDDRWQSLFSRGLRPYFENLRDVNRFASTLSFHAANFQTATGSEVNPVDLIGLEVLRMFEPELYRRLPSIKEILTGSRFSIDKTQEAEAAKKEVYGLLEHASDASRAYAREVLLQLFPRAAQYLGGTTYSSDHDNRWYREVRVAAADSFERYFGFAVPPGDLSQATLDRILVVSGNPVALRAEFGALADKKMLAIAFDRLDAYKEQFPLKNTVSLLTVILDVGETLPSRKEASADLFGPTVNATRIMHWHLKREADPQQRLGALKLAIAASTGFRLASDFVSTQRQRLESTDRGSAENTLFDEAAVSQLEQLCITKLEEAAKDGRLAQSPDLVETLFDWRRFGGEKATQEFCARIAETSEGALRLIVAFEQVVTSTTMGSYAPHYRWYIKLSNLALFVDPETVASSLAGLNREALTREERRALRCFDVALARRREGKPESDRAIDFDDDEDDD